MKKLATQKSCTISSITHNNRIFNITDRLIHMEDGRLRSVDNAVV